MHIMIDLETLGTAPGSVITSIGAIAFDPSRRLIEDEFYRRVCPISCEQLGMKIDASTVLWWLGQSDAARAEIQKEGTNISVALQELSEWFGKFTEIEGVWGNGAGFDNTHMEAAYRLNKTRRPWKYSHDRCYRTMKSMFPQIPMPASEGTAHNALDDARYQAQHLLAILHHIKPE